MKKKIAIRNSVLLFLTSAFLGWWMAPGSPVRVDEPPAVLSDRVLGDQVESQSGADGRWAEFRKLASREDQVRYLIALPRRFPSMKISIGRRSPRQ